MKRQKRILYFAENAVSPIQGGGIVVNSILDGLRPDNILGFSCYESVTPKLDQAGRFCWLPGFGIPGEHWLLPGPRPHAPKPPLSERLGLAIDRAAWRWKRIAASMGDLRATSTFGVVKRIVKDYGFSPEIVFFSGLSLQMLELALAASVEYDVPMLMLNMDDWMAVERRKFAYWGDMRESQVARTMKAVGARSLYNFSNSPHLAVHLTERYGVKHVAMNNACSDLLAGPARWTPPPRRKKMVVTFAGAMNWCLQGETATRVAEALSELAATHPVELHIYTPWDFAPLANQIQIPGKVIYKGHVAREDLVAAYLDSDFLLATTTFNENHLRLFRYSLATKLSDYLCVGRPVLSVGHPDWALHQYVDEHRAGISIRTADRSAIKTALLQAFETPFGAREEIGRRNRKLWGVAHDVRVMATELRDLLGLPNLVPPKSRRTNGDLRLAPSSM